MEAVPRPRGSTIIAGNLRPNRFDIPDYDPTTGFLLPRPRIQPSPNEGERILHAKAPLRLVVYRTEIRDGDGRVLYHGEQLECGHFHTEFLDANSGKQRRRCQACKEWRSSRSPSDDRSRT